MIRNPEELTTAIKSAVNRRAIVFSHLVLAVAITTHTVLWPATLPYERKLALAISIVLVGLILFRFFDLAKINNHPLIYIIIYEILTFIGISFLTEAATPYVLVAMITTLIANLYYGAKGVYATVVVFGLATITKYCVFLAEPGPLTREETLDIFAAFFVFRA
jgi:hypothetical protein